ncbi:MAG: dicarboxylate/amino acid:cation symporter [Opitutaceae bacterium]|nr:dicarboxylate/amino acid:cation symporter [Opitutaceae bacterium]
MTSLFRRFSLAQWMIIAAVAGVALGFAAPGFARQLSPISDIFLRLIRAIIAPLLFGVLVRAIAGAGETRNLGRIGLKAIVIFEVLTTIALLLGWLAGVLVQPGVGVTLPREASVPAAAPISFVTVLINVFPTSIIDAMARGDVLQIVAFSLLFGLAALSLGEKARPFLAFVDSLAEISFRFTRIIMLLAPAAVFAAMAVAIGGGGLNALAGLARFAGVAWAGQLFFLLVVLGGALLLARVPLARFAAHVREPFLVAFATTSSAAALPQTLENLERFGVPRPILGVVAPLSLSFNLCGSVIHLALATIFVAQAAGVNLTIEQQLMILVTLKLTSKGVAGIPRGNFVVLAAMFPSFGLPMEGLALLLGIDALIDPVRTSVNVVGHSVSPALVARWEGASLDGAAPADGAAKTAEDQAGNVRP